MSNTLEPTEPHPAAALALDWIRENHTFNEMLSWHESFASNAIEGNHLAEICYETLRRILNNEPVSDRYVLGLAWIMRDGEK